MQSTARRAWLVYDLSKDSFYLGLDTFLAQVPIILFSLVGGVIADRMKIAVTFCWVRSMCK